jgi:hypothetical protein
LLYRLRLFIAFFACLRSSLASLGEAFVFLLRLHAKQAFGIFLRSKKCEASKPKAVKQARQACNCCLATLGMQRSKNALGERSKLPACLHAKQAGGFFSFASTASGERSKAAYLVFRLRLNIRLNKQE